METETTQTTTTADLFETTVEPAGETGDQTKPVAQEGDKTPAPKTYDEATHQRAIEDAKASVKGGYEGTVKELKTQQKQLRQQLQDLQNAAAIAKVESEGGDVEQAKSLFSRETMLNAEKEALAEQKAALDSALAELNQAARVKKIDEYIKTYELDDTARPELEKAQDPKELETVALRLALKKTQAGVIPARKVEAGAGTSSGIDWNKLPARERLGQILAGQVK